MAKKDDRGKRSEREPEIGRDPETQRVIDDAEDRQMRAEPEGLVKPIEKNIIKANADLSILELKRGAGRGAEKAKAINAGPKKTVRLPMNDTDRDVLRSTGKAPRVEVTIDGYTWSIAKGVTVEVPLTVYEVLERTGKLDL